MILNSSVWGQIDSMLTVFLVLMCYLVYTDNMKFAYIVYGIGFLVKPQMVMFTPVLLLAFIEKIFVGEKEDGKYGFRFNSDELFMQGSYCIISIAVTILACVPFGLVNVFNQCFNTMGSYEYAAVNAYNFWGMLGLNWCSQDDYLFFLTYKQWGLVVIFALVVISVLIWLNNFKERSRYIIMGAFLGIGMFTLSVRMHERYIFPAIILLLVLFIVTKRINSLWLYAGFSIVSFYNTAHVLFYYDPYNFDREAAPIIITSFMTCVLFVFLSIYL